MTEILINQYLKDIIQIIYMSS